MRAPERVLFVIGQGEDLNVTRLHSEIETATFVATYEDCEMKKSFALGVLFLTGCGAVVADPHRDGGPDGATSDARPLDGPANDATGGSGGDGGGSSTPDAGAEDTRRTDSGGGAGGGGSGGGGSGGGNDAGSNPDVSVDTHTDSPGMDAPRIDSTVGTDAPTTTVDARSDMGNAPPDVGGPIDAGPADVVTPPPVDVVTPPKDVANETACPAESDAQFCSRLGKSCEAVSGTDNCGTQRTANCGTCGAGKACVDQVCQTPVCPSFNYTSSVYAPFSISGVQEYVVGASPDLGSVLYVQSPAGSCPGTPVYLADETAPGSGTYTSRDISSWWTSNSRGWASIMAGGLTMVTSSADAKSLGDASRSALNLIDFGAVSTANYAAVNGFLAGTSGTFGGTAISANGLELYYGITGISSTSDGVYRSTRSSLGAAFSVGQRIPSIDATYAQVSAISSDRLTLFVTANWAGYVFTRNSTSVEFSNPNGSNPPPTLQGWQHKPGKNCALFATYSPGGCLNQEIYYMTRQ